MKLQMKKTEICLSLLIVRDGLQCLLELNKKILVEFDMDR